MSDHDLVTQIMNDMTNGNYEVISHDKLKDSEIVEWVHLLRGRTPYMSEVLLCEPGHIVFDGYFYLEDATMPVERIIYLREGRHHVEIYEKKTVEDTSEYGPYDEEEGGHICFFPTAVIDLRYRIIRKLDTEEEYREAEKRITELEDAVMERDAINRRKTEEKELEEYNKSISAYLKK